MEALPDLVGGIWTLAKDMGKGGGGSTEEPTVCMLLLPLGLGILLVALGDARRALRTFARRLGRRGPLTAIPYPSPKLSGGWAGSGRGKRANHTARPRRRAWSCMLSAPSSQPSGSRRMLAEERRLLWERAAG